MCSIGICWLQRGSSVPHAVTKLTVWGTCRAQAQEGYEPIIPGGRHSLNHSFLTTAFSSLRLFNYPLYENLTHLTEFCPLAPEHVGLKYRCYLFLKGEAPLPRIPAVHLPRALGFKQGESLPNITALFPPSSEYHSRSQGSQGYCHLKDLGQQPRQAKLVIRIYIYHTSPLNSGAGAQETSISWFQLFR